MTSLTKVELGEAQREVGLVSPLEAAVRDACQEPTLEAALAHIAIWESERVVKQAIRHHETGVSTAGHGGGWDTCFLLCFREVLERYRGKDKCLACERLYTKLRPCDTICARCAYAR